MIETHETMLERYHRGLQLCNVKFFNHRSHEDVMNFQSCGNHAFPMELGPINGSQGNLGGFFSRQVPYEHYLKRGVLQLALQLKF